MRMEEPGELHWYLLSSARETGNQRRLCHIRSHRDTDPTQCLDSLRNRVHKFALFFVVLVVEKMKLIKGRACDLPMVFLVHIPKRYGIRKDLVEILDARFADGLRQGNRKFRDRSKGLNLYGVLIKKRPCAIKDATFAFRIFFHEYLSCFWFWTIPEGENAPLFGLRGAAVGPGAGAIDPSTDPIQH